MWSNCLIFATVRRLWMGGRAVRVPSRYGPWGHWFWTYDGLTFETFETSSTPLKRFYRRARRSRWPLPPPPLFPGRVHTYTLASLRKTYPGFDRYL